MFMRELHSHTLESVSGLFYESAIRFADAACAKNSHYAKILRKHLEYNIPHNLQALWYMIGKIQNTDAAARGKKRWHTPRQKFRKVCHNGRTAILYECRTKVPCKDVAVTSIYLCDDGSLQVCGGVKNSVDIRVAAANKISSVLR